MRFSPLDQAPARLNRRALAVPGSQPQMFAKAAAGADVIFLDLEDAVAPEERPQARRSIIKAPNEIDRGKKTLSLRINRLDTSFMYRGVVEVVEEAGARLDLIVIPKVGTAAGVYAVDMMLMQVGDARGCRKRIGFEPFTETAPGMQIIGGIAAASRRNESLQFGVAGCAARARTTIIGGVSPHHAVLIGRDARGARQVHWGDMWHHPLSRLVVAARADGLRPIDGPSSDFPDPEGCKAAAWRAAILGCEGKWALPPGQVAPANEAMSPSAAKVERAQCNLEALAQAEAEGKGAASLKGRLIDHASIRRAEVLVRNAHQIAA